MTKSWDPSWGKKMPGERPRETAETWQTGPQPSRYVWRKADPTLSGAEEQTKSPISAYAQYAYLPSLQMGSKHLTRLEASPTSASGYFELGYQRFVAKIYCDGQRFYWAEGLVFGNKRGN